MQWCKQVFLLTTSYGHFSGFFSFSLNIYLFVQTKKSTSASLSSLNKVIHAIETKEHSVTTIGVANAVNFFPQATNFRFSPILQNTFAGI